MYGSKRSQIDGLLIPNHDRTDGHYLQIIQDRAVKPNIDQDPAAVQASKGRPEL